MNNYTVMMKTYSTMVRISVGVAVAVLGIGINNSHAVSAAPIQIADGPGQSSLFQNVRWEEEKIEKLRHAYYLLDHAKGDYAGHRLEAMHSIKRAAGILGVELKGGGHEGESQWASDRKLREARRLMSELVAETGGKEQEHVHRAVKELDKALATR